MSQGDFVRILGKSEGLQKPIGKALECHRKRGVTAKVNECAVPECEEDQRNPVEFEWDGEIRRCRS